MELRLYRRVGDTMEEAVVDTTELGEDDDVIDATGRLVAEAKKSGKWYAVELVDGGSTTRLAQAE